MADRLETNWEEQECWLFAWLRRVVKRGPAISNYLEESFEEAMDQALGQIQRELCDPEWADKGPLVEELIDHLRDLEEELTEYEHLEREELFPRVREFFQSCAKEEEVSHAY